MAEPAWRLAWIEDAAGWAALAPRWRALAEAAAAPLFLEYEWLDCWWQVWAPPDRLQLRIAVACRGDELLAAWPLVLRVERRQGLTTRLLWSMGRPISDYWDMLLHPAAQSEAAALALAFVAALQARAAEWDLLELSEVRGDGEFVRHVVPRLGQCLTLHSGADSCCARLRIGTDWETYYATQLSAQRRRKIRKEWRLLAEQGAVELRCGGIGEAEVAALVEELAALEAEHPRHGPARPGALSEPRLGAFLRRLLPLAAQRGWLQLGLLRVGGEAAAYTLWFSHRRWHGGYATAFRDRYGASGVGKLLLLAMLEHLWRDGDSIDFLRGEQDYKQLFGADGVVNRRLVASHGGARSRFACWRRERSPRWPPPLRLALETADRGGWSAVLRRHDGDRAGTPKP